jgi:hypothetical protein
MRSFGAFDTKFSFDKFLSIVFFSFSKELLFSCSFSLILDLSIWLVEISKSNSLKGKVKLLSLWEDESFFSC